MSKKYIDCQTIKQYTIPTYICYNNYEKTNNPA